MIDTIKFADNLIKKYGFFAGVPDSTLKELSAALSELLPDDKFITTANEGNAVALCAGYTLTTGKPGVVYMQNSGLGNAINPLLSLNNALVYQIPVLLIIGWRGEPGVKDEPQHRKQGLITTDLLDVCGIPWRILNNIDDIDWADEQLVKLGSPVALLVKKDTFSPYKKAYINEYKLSREMAINTVLDALEGCEYRIVSTTGMISRELYALREKRGESHDRDFLTVGSMGHASSIALGIALQRPDYRIVCLDGDGAALMHLGAMAIIGTSNVGNYIHILLNNAAHDSVGGQPTVAGLIDATKIAQACGYSNAVSVSNANEFHERVRIAIEETGRFFIEVKVAMRGNADIGRPPDDLVNNRQICFGF